MSRQKKPAVGDKVAFLRGEQTVTGTVDLLMPAQFAVVVDEEFWVFRNGPLGRLPTCAREIILYDNPDWEVVS